MAVPGILIISEFLIDRLKEWAPPDCRLYGPDTITSGMPTDLASSVEIVICGGELANVLVDALPRLGLVACFSTGYAGIDLKHLSERGIALTTAAGVNAHDVADHAVALLLGWRHGLIRADRHVREGKWRDGLVPRHSLRGRHAGIVGLGRIGQATARRLVALEMIVSWWGPRDKVGAEFARTASLEALAAQSDVLIVTSRGDPASAGQIDAGVLHALGPEGLLINVSRGFLVDEAALIAALQAGTVGGAALDVFLDEPTDPALWSSLDNVLLSPHIAGYTREAGARMLFQLKTNVERYLRGERLLTQVMSA